jgi:hypothetical protein
VTDGGIANILHRETIAVLVGAKVFERGEACFAAGRVLRVEAGRGELRGSVRPEMRPSRHGCCAANLKFLVE